MRFHIFVRRFARCPRIGVYRSNWTRLGRFVRINDDVADAVFARPHCRRVSR